MGWKEHVGMNFSGNGREWKAPHEFFVLLLHSNTNQLKYLSNMAKEVEKENKKPFFIWKLNLV